jgi:hypothetical protein
VWDPQDNGSNEKNQLLPSTVRREFYCIKCANVVKREIVRVHFIKCADVVKREIVRVS